MKPFVKWAGGKRQILNSILPYINKDLKDESRYYEPFIGGGSVFFTLGRQNCVINDLNNELINCYEVIRDEPEKLIKELKLLEEYHDKERYYEVRELDRNLKKYRSMSNIKKAARTIYLNKTCYNGLYRVNNSGYFNTPIGKYKNPNIVDEMNIREISKFLNDNNIIIRSTSFEESVKDVAKGDFIYFDPPYDYEDKGFTKYVKDGFGEQDLINLKKICDLLIKKGCKVLISNNATDRVLKLFDSKHYSIVAVAKYEIKEIDVRRYIGANNKSRKFVKEVLIYGH